MSIVLTANLTPAGNFPVATTEVISGGYKTVATLVDRDAIPTVGVDSAVALVGFRRAGMLVYVQATGDTYLLNAPLTNADWVLQGLSGAITPADYTAKGVILVGTGVGTETALSVGVNGLVLTADNTQPTGVKWDVAVPGGGAIPVPAPAATDLYVSGLNGNDLNDGSSPVLAVATLARAWELIPYTLAAPFVIHLGAAGAPGVAYAWSPMPTPTQLTPAARIWLYGDGAGQAGEDGFVVVAGSPVVAIVGTDANQITTAAIVADAYQGFTLEVVDGPAAGYRRTILTNTTSSIVPARRFETEDTVTAITPAVGNTIRILRPSVLFSGYDTAGNTDGIPGLFSGIGNGDGGAPLFLVNLGFTSVSNQTEINRCTVFGAGVEFRGAVAPIFTNCNGSFGNWDNIFDTAANQGALPQGTNLSLAKTNWFTDIGVGLVPSPLATWRGWGISQPDVTAVTTATTGPRFLNCQMSMFATVGDLHGSSSTLTLGGRFWGDVTLERGFYHLIGRADFGVGSNIKSSIFARKIRSELCTVFAAADAGAFGFTYAAAADPQWSSISCDVQMLNSGVFTSALSAFLEMTCGGTFELGAGSAWQFNHQLNATSAIGCIQIKAGTFKQVADFSATNSLAGVLRQGATFIVEQSGIIEASGVLNDISGNPAALFGSNGIIVRNGGQFRHTTALTLNTPEILIDGGSFIMSADLTSSTANGQKAITLQNHGDFSQTTGVLTLAGAGAGSGIGVDGSTWLSSGGSASISVLTALNLTNGAQFVLTAGAGAWAMTSTGAVNCVSSAEGSTFIADCSSLTLAAATFAISSQNSEIVLTPTTLVFTTGGLSLSDSSKMFVNTALVMPGALSVTQDSELTSTAAFTVTLAATVTTSKCVLNSGTSFLDALTANFSDILFNSTVSITGALNITNTRLNHNGTCTLLGLADGENSEWIINGGNLACSSSFVMLRCDLKVNGDFSALSCTMTDSDMSVSGTHTVTNLTLLQRASKLVVSGTFTSGTVTLTGLSDLLSQGSTFSGAVSITDSTALVQSNTVLTGDLTLDSSRANFTGSLVGTGLFLLNSSELITDSTCSVSSVTGENSSAILDATLTNSGASTFLRCYLNIAGSFSTTSATFTTSDAEIAGTYTCTNTTTLQRTSKLAVTGAVSSGDIVLTTASELFANTSLVADELSATDSSLQAGATTLAVNGLDLIHSRATFTGRLTAFDIQASSASELKSVDFAISTNAVFEDSSTWVVKGDATTSSISTASAVGSLLSILSGSDVNFRAMSFVATLSKTGGAAAGVQVTQGGSLNWSNNRLTVVSSAALVTGIDFEDGGFLYCNGSPTNINGSTQDFLDNQGGFANTQLPANRTIYSGQHPAGVYSAAAVPTGASCVQVS
jgi:hypothetical protein